MVGETSYNEEYHAPFNPDASMPRIERQRQESDCTKWDGVAFTILERNMAAILIEFSGGIKSNSGKKKDSRDAAAPHAGAQSTPLF